jgi:hypothetical protein
VLHAAVTPEWSKRAAAQLVMVWHSSQLFEEAMWPGGLPGTRTPL